MATPQPSTTPPTGDPVREAAIAQYRKKFLEHREMEAKVKKTRFELRGLVKEFDKTEDDLKAVQNVGQIIGEVLKQLDPDRFIVKASSGPRYVVGVRSKVNKAAMTAGTRVALDMTTLTIMRTLPREVDPVVFNMLNESPGSISYSDIGGLNEQIRELREVIELPLTNPDLFKRVGIKPPKGVLLYGPPGTGKTLLARALANNIKASYLKVVASAIVDKYIGESARIIREMFGYAKEHQPCVIFMDEVDAIGGRRFSQGTSADREIQRTLMELLNQLDGFDDLGRVKMVMATNRPDTLDPALLRPGRLDRKIEIPIPSESNRLDILKIHAANISKHGDIDYEGVVKLCEGFNGADLRNVCITGDHRVLTRSGWKSIAHVQVGDEVLSFNKDTVVAGKKTYHQEWKAVRAVQCYPVDSKKETDQLYRMQGSGMDVIATRDHSLLLARLNTHSADGLQLTTPVEYETVGQVLPPALTYRAKSTSEVTQFRHTQARAVVCAGLTIQPAIKIVIPGLERVCDWWWEQDQQLGFLQFLGFWLGNGFLAVRFGMVQIGQKKGASNEWLQRLLDDVFPRWWNHFAWGETNPGMEQYSIRCPPLYEYLRVMAVGPLGYNPRDPASLRAYPHFNETKEQKAENAALAAEELKSSYYKRYNSTGTVSSWSETEMLAAMKLGPERCMQVTCGSHAGDSSPPSTTRSLQASSSSTMDVTSEAFMEEEDEEDEKKELAAADDDAPAVTEVVDEAGDEVEVPIAEAVVDDEGDKKVGQALRDAGKVVWHYRQRQPVTAVADAAVVPWNNGLWLIINGHWYYLKRWMGDEQQIASVYSQLSRQQAVALLDGFCRADGRWSSIQYVDVVIKTPGQPDRVVKEPTGQWSCSSSSFPLIDHLQLIGQLAGAAVDLHRTDKAGGRTSAIKGRPFTYTVDHWALFFSFTKSERGIPFQTAPLAEPVDVSKDVDARGYYDYKDVGLVYDITVHGNSNFLTQRLSNKRLQTGDVGVRAHAVFSGNCTEAGMFAIRVERGYVIEEDFMKAARKIMETKKLEGKLEYEKV